MRLTQATRAGAADRKVKHSTRCVTSSWVWRCEKTSRHLVGGKSICNANCRSSLGCRQNLSDERTRICPLVPLCMFAACGGDATHLSTSQRAPSDIRFFAATMVAQFGLEQKRRGDFSQFVRSFVRLISRVRIAFDAGKFAQHSPFKRRATLSARWAKLTPTTVS